jgi:fumarate reductase flavoprotein subunit
MLGHDKGERLAVIRDAMRETMEIGVGIYRTEEALQASCAMLGELRERYRRGVKLDDRNRAFNTEWLTAIELGFMLDVAGAIAHSALQRQESRGAHMRLEFTARDDERFLKHSLALYRGNNEPTIDYAPVTITKSKPKARVYGGAGKQAVMT